MKNFWLKKLRVGKRVRYKGLDPTIQGKIGYIKAFTKGVLDDWVDVEFEFIGLTTYKEIVTVEKDSLEVI